MILFRFASLRLVYLSVLFVRGYQLLLSPALSLFFGPLSGCRFHPSCSQFAIQSFLSFGFFVGLKKTVQRLLTCHPFHFYNLHKKGSRNGSSNASSY